MTGRRKQASPTARWRWAPISALVALALTSRADGRDADDDQTGPPGPCPAVPSCMLRRQGRTDCCGVVGGAARNLDDLFVIVVDEDDEPADAGDREGPTDDGQFNAAVL
jgi:hypothetical protein